MRSFSRYLTIIFISFCSVYPSGAQSLPPLPKAAEIVTGELDNGISYYLINNSHAKGFADFALVQSGVPDVGAARRALAEAPHFRSRVPFRFLADSGIACTERGYISYLPESVRFDFRQVPVFRRSVSDSTLLLLMDIASTSRYKQAIVISGDIPVNETLDRMKVLSMVLDSRETYRSPEPYSWKPKDKAIVKLTGNHTSDIAAIHVIYSSERVARENMNTSIPLVMDMYAYQLGSILSRKIKEAFRNEGIPLADIRYSYQNSAKGPEDERYRLTVFTGCGYADRATALLASILGQTDNFGLSPEEVQEARDRMISNSLVKRGKLSNSEYVDKCVASWLYGASLAPESTMNNFVSDKRLSGEREVQLFNNYVSTLLDPEKNLVIRCDSPSPIADESVILNSFSKNWNSVKMPEKQAFKASFSDTLKLYAPTQKVKLRSESPDPMTGGKLWTFQNGIKVLFKKTSTPGEFHYALMLRGGYSNVPGIKNGEGAFVGDMLALSSIAGVSGNDFFEILSANGIEMKNSVSLSDMRITGKAPRNKLDLTLRALLSVANLRQTDKDAFETYRKEEAMRIDMAALSPRDVNAQMDSIINKGNGYHSPKRISNLGKDLNERCEKYFKEQFGKVTDGILVLTGDLSEDDTKKELCRILGDFSVSKKFSPRPSSGIRTPSGTTTLMAESVTGTIGGRETGVNVMNSANIDFTPNSYMSFKIAALLVEKALAKVLAEYGTYAEVTEKVEILPSEKFSLFINCHPCYRDGVPENVEPEDPMIILGAVRRALDEVCRGNVTDAELAAFKDLLTHREDVALDDPDTYIGRILTRFSEGKDTISGYKSAIGSVTKESVKAVLKALDNGAKVEYVII